MDPLDNIRLIGCYTDDQIDRIDQMIRSNYTVFQYLPYAFFFSKKKIFFFKDRFELGPDFRTTWTAWISKGIVNFLFLLSWERH